MSAPGGTDAIAREVATNVARRALREVECSCHEGYYDRRLEAPDCRHHDLARELADIVVCDCTGCERLR